MLHQLQVHREILYKLAALYLEPLGGSFERLFYLASLCDRTSATYKLEALSATFGEPPVNEALARAHEELFEALLELPLAQQELDLRAFLQSRAGVGSGNFEFSEESIRDCMPPDAPAYLKSLFRSNVDALRELLPSRPSRARSGK